jgi:hypothetical protein
MNPGRGVDVRSFVRDSEERATALLDGLRARIARQDLSDFRDVLRGTTSTSTRWDRVRGREVDG